jgi:phage/plasmid-like protein (TIGR03299 family)
MKGRYDMPADFERGATREPAWHGLSKVVGEHMTSDQALQITDLDFEPMKVPTFIQLPNGDLVANPETFAIARMYAEPDGSYRFDKIIGPKVGTKYKAVAPRASMSMFDQLVDENAAHWESFGTLKGGRVLFGTMKIPDHITVGDGDEVDFYLTLLDSYDGSSPLRALIAPIVVVCTNTARMASNTAARQWSLRHTGSIDGRVAQARESLGLTFTYMEEFEKEMAALVAQDYTLREFEKLATQLLPGEPDDGERFTDPQYDLINLFDHSPNITDSTRFSKYGASMAVTEYGSWVQPLDLKWRRSKVSDAERLTEATWMGSGVELFDKALRILTTV